MNTKRMFSLIFVLVFVFLSGCSAAAPTAIATYPQQEARPLATQAPMIAYPTQAYAAEPTIASEPSSAPTRTVDGNTFQDPGVNPPTNTQRDMLSTFGLDVDTASYTVARSYINDGSLPPYDAVRVEEFVNYFDGGYPTPRGTAFGIYADAAPAPMNRGEILLRAGVQGYQVQEIVRKSASLVFVIDTSGSMSMQNRLETVKYALNKLVDQLYPDDQIAIVTFGSNARIIMDFTSGSNKDKIRRVINRLNTNGSTNAAEGLRLGYRLAVQNLLPEGINRVILCSDGVANTGLTDSNDIFEMIEGAVDQNVQMTSIGVGMGNFNDALLEDLANRGDGNYYYIDSNEQAEKVFVDDLTGTLQMIARDARVQVEFNPEVVATYRLLGYENREVADEDFRNDEEVRQQAGELGAGHSATAVYALTLQPYAEGSIATVYLRWIDPETDQPVEINGTFNTWDITAHYEETDPHYQIIIAAAMFADYLRQSPWMQEASLADLAWLAENAARNLPGDADAAELADLLNRAAGICQYNRCW